MRTVEYYQDGSGAHEWRWRTRADNGEIDGASHEGFASKQKARENFELQDDETHEVSE